MAAHTVCKDRAGPIGKDRRRRRGLLALWPLKLGNPIYLTEDDNAWELPVFEIGAAHRSRTISLFLSRCKVGVLAAGWTVGGSGRQRPRRWPPAVVEGSGGGRSAGQRLGFRVSGWWRRVTP
jgi:hypothetical protein